MIDFSLGDHVIIRYGLQQGQKATIVKCRHPDTYLVRVEDGTVRFYSGKGMAKAESEIGSNGPAHLVSERTPMTPKKTLPEREKELQALLATPAGRAELQELDTRYRAESGKERSAKASIITYILIHERLRGEIAG
jgi:hypothetical protein